MTVEIEHTELLNMQEALTKANKIIETIIKRYYEEERGKFDNEAHVMVWDNDDREKKYAIYKGYNPDSKYPFMCYVFMKGEMVEVIQTFKNAKEMTTEQSNLLLKLTRQ